MKASLREIESWLSTRIALELNVDPQDVDSTTSFAAYGVSSIQALSIIGDLEQWLGVTLSPALIYEHHTIEKLAMYLSGEHNQRVSSSSIQCTPGEHLAIVGMSCRFPGANSPSEFWRLLEDGVDAVTTIPSERWAFEDYYDPIPQTPGKTNSMWGGFLSEVDQFDPLFFAISPREAVTMDPQQRILLELAWEALEDAGQVLEYLAGSKVGVFIGISTYDYSRVQFEDLTLIDVYSGSGNALSVAANRISYTFDFRGPSIAVDTACSSSLVAVHLACQSIWNGEASTCLAGGINLILSPAVSINFAKAGLMASDGRCKSFDASADGYVRSEGAGVVYIKPLSQAVIDGDRIYAVIVGSAVNQDGRTNGLMAPSRQAQETLLKEVYERAGISPGSCQFVETHGTGTLLGDAIEATAIGEVIGKRRPLYSPVSIGSVKTNIGHAEAAAGIAGLIKVALSLYHGRIPANLHYSRPNPHISFDGIRVQVQQALGEWPQENYPATAGVSSFGFGGTNAHVILQSPSHSCSSDRSIQVGGQYPDYLVLPVSAKSRDALMDAARAYYEFLNSLQVDTRTLIEDICYTAGARRTHHDHRLTVMLSSRQEGIELLETFLKNQNDHRVLTGQATKSRSDKLVFVYSGQGSQWVGMAKDLFDSEIVFKRFLQRCEQAMRKYADWSLLENLLEPSSERRLDLIEIIQPAIFAVQVGLTELWKSWGVEPDAVIGHSMGEVAAAYVAKAIDLETAVQIIIHRSKLLERISGMGSMMQTGLSQELARSFLDNCGSLVSIAAVNGPTSTVLSGETCDLEELRDTLAKQDIFCRFIDVDVASHGPQVDSLIPELVENLRGIQTHESSTQFYSTVSGRVMRGSDLGAEYWASNLRQPVRFMQTVQILLDTGHNIFLEVSPHPILADSIQQTLAASGHNGTVLPSLSRQEVPRRRILRSLCALYVQGIPVKWNQLYGQEGRVISLPQYPWQHKRYWLSSKNTTSKSADHHHVFPTELDPVGSDLGRPIRAAVSDGDYFWDVYLSISSAPFLEDHKIQGTVVVPAGYFIKLGLEAAAHVIRSGQQRLTGIQFHNALFLANEEERVVQVVLSTSSDNEGTFRIYSTAVNAGQSTEKWTIHASGILASGIYSHDVGVSGQVNTHQIESRCPQEMSGRSFYKKLENEGILYGPRFQSVLRLRSSATEALSQIGLPKETRFVSSSGGIDHFVLDACFQTLGSIRVGQSEDRAASLYLPISVDDICVNASPHEIPTWCHARLASDATDSSGSVISGHVSLLDHRGQTILEAQGIHLQRVGDPDALQNGIDDLLFELIWEPRKLATQLISSSQRTRGEEKKWLILADRLGLGEQLASQLASFGDNCCLGVIGDRFEHVEGSLFSIRPESKVDLQTLVDLCIAGGKGNLSGVVYMWGLDFDDLNVENADVLNTACMQSCASISHLVQILSRLRQKSPPRIWLVTRGAQQLPDSNAPTQLAQTPIWGLGRTISQENSEIWGGIIDLDPESTDAENALLLAKETYVNQDAVDREEVLLRQKQRFVSRLARIRHFSRPARAFRWQTNGAYLITGGLGDLGLSVAQWMVEEGARRLILLGRTKLPPREQWRRLGKGNHISRQVEAILDLEARGASVQIASVDVSDNVQLEAFLKDYREASWPPIRGVVHAAGVVRLHTVLDMDLSETTDVFRPKILGSWHLHRLFEDSSLDFFVLFSSVSSVLGSPLLGSYAAANAFLDGLAHYRRGRDLTSISINWGPWSQIGMAARYQRATQRDVLVRGMKNIEPSRGLAVLDFLMKHDATQVVVMGLDRKALETFHNRDREIPVLSRIIRQETFSKSRHDAKDSSQVELSKLLVAMPAEREAMIEAYLSSEVAQLLGLSESEVSADDSLNGLGLDSIMALQLKNRIEEDLKCVVPLIRLLKGVGIAELTAEIASAIGAKSQDAPIQAERAHMQSGFAKLRRSLEVAARSAGQVQVHNLVENIDKLSEEEINLLLEELLQYEASMQ